MMQQDNINKKADIELRIGAFIIDYLIITAIFMIPFLLNFQFILEGDIDLVLRFSYQMIIFAFLIFILKDIVKGVSFGKWLVGIKVSDKNNYILTPNIFRLMLRNIFILIWPIEFLVFLISKDKRRIGDIIAKTDVIISNRNK